MAVIRRRLRGDTSQTGAVRQDDRSPDLSATQIERKDRSWRQGVTSLQNRWGARPF